MVEAEHTIKYSAPVPVTVEEPPEETEDDEINFDDVEIERPSRRKKTSKDERDDLRRELDKYGTVSASRLKLSIDKYRHSDADDSGTLAEKDFCTKYAVTKDHILADDYLDVARKYGPGRYWFTLRMDNRVVRQWERKVHETVTPATMNPVDPNQAAFFAANGDAAQPIGQLSWQEVIKMQDSLFERKLKEMKLFRDAFGIDQMQPNASAPLDPKVAALQMIAENPDVMEKIGKGIASTVLGAKGGGDSDPWADVAMEAIKSGQAAQIAATIIREIMAPFRNMRGEESAQTFQAPQPAPVQTERNGGPQGRNAPQPTAPVSAERPQERPAAAQPMMTPADALMMALIDAMIRNAPLKEAQGIINVAVYRNPELDESIDELLNLSVDELMALLAVYHPKVAEVPHAKEWLETLVGSLAQQEAAE